MTRNKILLTLCSCIFALCSMKAQVSLVVSDATGQKGQIIDVNVKVVGFDSIESMQFSINWDSTVLAFEAIENLSEELPQFTNREIGLTGTSSGAIRIAWFDNATRGVSVADSTQLFNLKFKLIGAAGTTSNISISDSPIAIEFTGKGGNVLEIEEIVEGLVSIPGNSTAVTTQEAGNGMQLHQNEPNPFYETTKIKITFSTIEPVQLFITDALGRVVYRNSFRSKQGNNTIEIGRNLLKTPGTYYYTLQSKDYHLSKKMILSTSR